MTSEQSRYQVRFDWGVDGMAAIGIGADVVVWVDAIEDGIATPPPTASARYLIAAQLPSARAAAQWVLSLQERLGERISIAVIAAGSRREGGHFRFAVEDLLAAGAVIAELGRVGLDATSPEAAAAAAAYAGLEGAVAHLFTASVTAQDDRIVVARASGRVDPNLTADDIVVISSRE